MLPLYKSYQQPKEAYDRKQALTNLHSPALANDMLAQFLNESPDKMIALVKAIHSQDLGRVENEAKIISGIANEIGAMLIFETAEKILTLCFSDIILEDKLEPLLRHSLTLKCNFNDLKNAAREYINLP